MNLKTIRRTAVPGVAALALLMSACGAGNDSADGGDSGLSGTINGGGSSAQATAQDIWKAGFQGDNSGATVNYNKELGSGGGRTGFIDKSLDFAGSDSYLKDDDDATELTDAKERCGGEDPIEVPAYVSPIAVIYNLEGVDSLQLSAATIAKIFDEKITKWNDPAIKAENPDANLPDSAITPVHRSDESGTTENFTDYLVKAAPAAWKHDKDKVWPQGLKGEAAAKTDGVVGAVTQGAGTIGYADHSAIGDLKAVSVMVGEEYVAPSAEAAAKTLAVSKRVEGRSDVDMAIDIDRTTTEAGAYPIILASYLIACQHYDDQAKADLVKGYLTYVVSSDGQEAAANPDAAGSAPLDAELAAEAAEIVAKIAKK